MKTRTKIIMGIIVLVALGSLMGKDAKPQEVPSNNLRSNIVLDENKNEPSLTVESKSETHIEEVYSGDSLATNVKKEQIYNDDSYKDEVSDLSGKLEVHYIDVGQGDASLIICGDEAMLVDAGDEGKGTAIQLYLKKHKIDRLKYVVATHPDADHIGGLDVIVYKFDCGQILIPNCSNDTNSFEQLQYSMKAKGYSPHVVDVGEKYSLGEAQIEILSPSAEFTFAETNDSSIVFRLDYGNNSFLFTGDATIPPQQALIYDPDLDIDVDVLKVPHHGASTAYIKGFYDEVSPKYAVISCGRNNRYGHPRQEVLNDLKNRGAKVFRTDEQGTIVAYSDGKEITWSCKPSTTWKSGEDASNDPKTDNNTIDNSTVISRTNTAVDEKSEYVANKNTHKFHYSWCDSVSEMKEKNKLYYNGTREDLINKGYKPCKRCNP